MGFGGFFLSFRGRLSRKSYWLRLLLAFLIFVVGFAVVAVIAFLVSWKLRGCQVISAWHSNNVEAAIIAPLLLADFVFYIWAVFAVTVRRCHDLGFPGRDMFSFRVANLNLGFKRGMIGMNEYGPDPLGGETP